MASEIKAKHKRAHVRYIGQIGDPMTDLARNSETIDKQYSIFAGKWRRYHGIGTLNHISDIKTVLKNIRDMFLVILGFVQSFFILVFWRPDVVFVKGGFVGLPVGTAAALLCIPIVTHDSDCVPGLTNRILSKFSKLNAVGLPIENYKKVYSLAKLRYTGIPIDSKFYVNSSFSAQESKKRLGIKADTKAVMFIGGSLGAIRMNEAILKIINKLLSDKSMFVLWVTGSRQHEEIKDRLSKMNINTTGMQVVAFSNDIPTLINASDIVVSRAGATAIAELAAAKKPVILVPNPILAGGHQVKNAQSIQAREAALVVSEQQLKNDSNVLLDEINKLLTDVKLASVLKNNLSSIVVPNAAGRIVDVLDEVAR